MTQNTEDRLVIFTVAITTLASIATAVWIGDATFNAIEGSMFLRLVVAFIVASTAWGFVHIGIVMVMAVIYSLFVPSDDA